MTLNEFVEECLIAGIPYSDVFEYSIAEASEIIKAKKEREKREDRRKASLLMAHASMIGKMVSGTGTQKIDMLTEFPWLFDEGETREIKVERYKAKLGLGQHK